MGVPVLVSERLSGTLVADPQRVGDHVRFELDQGGGPTDLVLVDDPQAALDATWLRRGDLAMVVGRRSSEGFIAAHVQLLAPAIDGR